MTRLATIAALLAGTAAPALAQPPAEPAPPAAPASVPTPPPGTAPAAADGGDIIVTAQRRDERLQDVPMAITALSAQTLRAAGVTATPDLARVTPGLVMNFYGGFLQPSIRGVTSTGANLGESSNVATYVDGVYQPQQIATLLDLPDVEQVEVLKGPQGALYGQNATGGAILVTSAAPSFTWKGRASASYGNYDNVDLRGHVSGPIADTLAFSLAGGYHDHDGFRRHVVTGERDLGLDSKVMRGKLLFAPAPDAKITLTGYYSDFRDSAMYAGFAYRGNSIGYAPDVSAVFGLPAGTFPVPATPRVTRASQFSSDPDVFTRVRSWGTNLRGEFDTGIGKVNALVAYMNNRATYLSDVDYSAVNLATASTRDLPGRYVVADVNLASRRFGPVSVLVGGFFLGGRETFNFNTFTLLAPTVPPAPKVTLATLNTFGRIRKRIFAGYGEIQVQPVDRLFLTAGGRYTHEEQRGFSGDGVAPAEAYPGNTVAFDKFTPRVTARYELSPAANVYASWGKGFKSGGINLTRFDLPPYRPETITSYEAGFKGRLSGTLRVEVSGFLYRYRNLQIVQYEPPNYFEENAASARLKGIDFSVNWQPVAGLTLTAGGTYLDANYREAVATVYIPTGFGNIPTPGTDVSGNRLIRAPRFTGTFSAGYEFDTGLGRLGASGRVYRSSSYPFEIQNRIRQGGYTLLDAQLSLAPASLPRMRIVAWGKNLTNKAYLASLLQSQFADGVSYAEPRTYGVRAEFSF